jgi:capsular polysaccharide transport system permease protein
MPNNEPIKKVLLDKELIEKTTRQRKLAKLKNKPMQFIKDSVAYDKAQESLIYTRVKFGSFTIVILAFILLVIYFTLIASPRYVSEAQIVVKEADGQDSSILGLSGLGAVSVGLPYALILQSREMATALNEAVSLEAHYELSDWDSFSRLAINSTMVNYEEYYQNHIQVIHDGLSDVLMVEVQTFDADYSLTVTQALLSISEKFINGLGSKTASEQMKYAQDEVVRFYAILSKNQTALINFQNKFKL